MGKKYRFVFRNTAAGHSGWPSSDIRTLERNDEDVCTTVLLGATNSTSVQQTADELKSYVCNLGSSRSNRTATNSGYGVNTDEQAAMLGGHGSVTSGARFEFFSPPGPYKFRGAWGSTSGDSNNTLWAFFDGDDDTVDALFSGLTKSVWASGMAATSGTVIVNPTDRTCWRGSASGTAGTDIPNGSGATYVDNNGYTWNRMNYGDGAQLIAQVAVRKQTTTASQVVDSTGAVVSTGTWGANVSDITISGNYGDALCIKRFGSGAHPVVFEFEQDDFDLADVSTRSLFGVTTGLSPPVYAGEPTGMKMFEITRSAGEENYTFLDPWDAYLTTAVFNGKTYAVSAGRIPDALAGARTITVRQTDPIAGTHDTDLAVTVISSEGRPTTGLHGAIATKAWLNIWRVKTADEAGFQGAEGTADVVKTVASMAAFNTAWQEVAAAVEAAGLSSTGKYEIQLESGTYTGEISGAHMDMRDGWLRIRPADGHDPEFNAYCNRYQHRVHWDGVRCPTEPDLRSQGTTQFDLSEPTAAGINGNGRFLNIRFTNMRLGLGFSDTWDPEDFANRVPTPPAGSVYAQFFSCDHAEKVVFKDCKFKGTRTAVAITGARVLIFEDNDAQWSKRDLLSTKPYNNEAALHGVFEDDFYYYKIKGTKHRNEIDFEGYENAAHMDLFQVNRLVGSNEWSAGGAALTQDGAPATSSGARTFIVTSVNPMRVYRQALDQTGFFGATPPTGTDVGVTEVNGDVTVEYLGALPEKIGYVWFEGNNELADAEYKAECVRQFVIDSNANRNTFTYLTVIDNATSNTSTNGVAWANGEILADFNCMIGPARIADVATAENLSLVTIRSDKTADIWVQRSIFCGIPNVVDGKLFIDRGVTLVTSEPSDDPGAVLNGPFARKTTGTLLDYWEFPTVDDSGTNSPQAFAYDLRSHLASLDLDATGGIWTTGPTAEADAYTLTGPSAAVVGTPFTISLELNGGNSVDYEVDLAASGVGATFEEDPVEFVGGEVARDIQVTALAAGALTITPTATGGLSNPSALVIMVSNPPDPEPDPDEAVSYSLARPGEAGVFVGEAFDIELTLDGVNTVGYTIDLAFTGVAASGTPDPVVFAIGETFKVVSVTATEPGALTITPDSDGDLIDADALVVTVEAVPTAYAVALDRTLVRRGGDLVVTFTLKDDGVTVPAFEDVTITPGVSGVSGSFSSPTVIIATGETTGQVTFTPTTPGIGSLSASDDLGLTDPAAVQFRVAVASRGQLVKMLGVPV